MYVSITFRPTRRPILKIKRVFPSWNKTNIFRLGETRRTLFVCLFFGEVSEKSRRRFNLLGQPGRPHLSQLTDGSWVKRG